MTHRPPYSLIHLGLLAAVLTASGCKPTQPTGLLGAQPSSPAPAPGGQANNPRTDDRPAPPQSDNQNTPLPPGGTGVPLPAPPPLSSDGAGGGFISKTKSLTGTVGAPPALIGDHGTGIISNNGANIIGNNGGNIIGNNAANIISNNGSGFISKTKYGLLGLPAGADGVLTNAFLYLTNLEEKFYFDAQTGKVFTARTDANGNYGFAIDERSNFPLNKDVIVNAALNDNLRLTGYITPIEGKNTLTVNLASTLATELLRGEAYRTSKALGAFDWPLFLKAVGETDQAIRAGDLEALKQVTDQAGETLTVGTFDLRMDHVEDLRNQYVIALSAVASSNTLVKQLSDTWKSLLGYRPTAVTTVIGNGAYPTVYSGADNGFADGDHLEGEVHLPGPQIAMGNNYGVAVGASGDIFITAYTQSGNSGYIRWIKPDGAVSSIWLPDFELQAPLGVAILKEPGDPETNPGYLAIADQSTHMVVKVPIVDYPIYAIPEDDSSGPLYPITILAGEGDSYFDDEEHPRLVDGVEAQPEVDSSLPLTSVFRLTDEGDRRYVSDNTAVPTPARFAYLNGPNDVAVDDLGNLYIADMGNQRIRMIVGAGNGGRSFYDYRTPVDLVENRDWNNNGMPDATPDGLIDLDNGQPKLASTPTLLKEGAIYTIAGNPDWEPTKTPDDGAFWFGDYAGDDGPAQLAKLDKPFALTWHDGYLYFSDFDNQRIRRISRATGRIETVAGNPSGPQRANTADDYDFPTGLSGDGGPARSAQLGYPRGLSFDGKGRLYFVDSFSGRIRMVDKQLNITTVGGRLHEPTAIPTDNFSDGEALRWADLYDTFFLDVDPDGNVLFTDDRHLRTRKLWRQWE